jgi:folate-binding protein YgfZ
MISNDVKNLADGQWMLASMLSQKGKLVAPFWVGHLEERFWIVVEKVVFQTAFENLRKFIVRDDVRVEDATDAFEIASVTGERAPEFVGAASVGDFRRFQASSGDAYLFAADDLARPTYHILLPKSEALAWKEGILKKGTSAMKESTFETLRIEAGIPRFSVDVTEENLLLEVPYLERGVSFTKGCYVGQETVARVHSRGGNIARRLMGIQSENEFPVGAVLEFTGADVGRITSRCYSPKLGKFLGMALVHRSAFEPGTEVTMTSSDRKSPGRVVSLPLPTHTNR